MHAIQHLRLTGQTCVVDGEMTRKMVHVMAKQKTPAQQATEEAYGNASHLLIAALEAVPVEHHPDQPFHNGGPQPKVDAARYVEAVIWAANRVKPYVDADDRAEFDRRVGLAKQQLKLGRKDKTIVRELLEGSRGNSSKVPLKIAAWTCHEAHNWIARPIYAGGAARPATRQLAALILKKQGEEAAAQFLVDVDDLCIHLEAMYMLDNHELAPHSKPTRTLWRGSAGDKAVAWILELANKELALISKIGKRWNLTEGDRTFVLAHLPDDQLDGAAKATDA